MSEAMENLQRYASSCWSTNEPFWRKLDRSEELRAKFAGLKSDEVARVAPWAIFGDVPKRRRS